MLKYCLSITFMGKLHLKEICIEPQKNVIEKAKRGDRSAIHHLYKTYSIAMLNVAFRILNNREDAEDAIQDCFIKVFSNLDKYDYQSTFGAWLKRIVINHSIDELKKKRTIDFNQSHKLEYEYKNEIEQKDYTSKGKLDAIYNALHQLPDGYRTVLSLYMLEGYDHNEISEILNIEVSTSISQLSRAKTKLKSLITKK